MSTQAKTDPEVRETKGARTRARIKQTIIDLVSDASPVDVTLAHICEAADVTVGAFYFHFTNKESALKETACDAIRDYYGTILDVASQRAPLERQLTDIMKAYLQNFTDHAPATRFIRMVMPASQKVKLAWDDERKKLSGELERMIAEARGIGNADPISFFMTEFLLTATEAFLENLYFGTDDRLQAAAGAPDIVIRNIAAIWQRAILNPNRIGDYL